MNVTREVILDLLPTYLAGEASPDTRALVDAYLAQDAELARRVEGYRTQGLEALPPPSLPPGIDLRSLSRTRRLLAWQRWLLGLAWGFSCVSLAIRLEVHDGGVHDVHLLLRDYPAQVAPLLGLGIACWIAYFALRRHLRATGL